MKLDMHFHSVASDGKNTREELLEEGQKRGLQFLALTDHNRVSYDFREQAKSHGIQSCQSVEISSYNPQQEKTMHILLYAKHISQEVSSLLDKVIMSVSDLILGQILFLKDLGFSLEVDEFFLYYEKKGKNSHYLTRKDLAEYLYQNPENKNRAISITKISQLSYEQFYDIFLKSGGEYAIDIHDYNPTLEQCHIFQQKTQGVLSLAHPNVTFRRGGVDEFEKWLPIGLEHGINALEINACATVPWVISIIKASMKYKLYLTFGSDNHKIGYTDSKHGDFGCLNPLVNERFVTGQFEKYKEKIVS